MRWLKRGAALMLTLLIGLGLIAWQQFHAPVPDDPQTVSAPGLSAPATIRYDARNRPFVQAADFQDAVFVQGWLHARERYWQMELLRRAGKGRLAELLGSGLLATDTEITLAGVPALARQMINNAGPETLAVVDAYIAGINLAVATLPAPLEFRLLGAEPSPWTRADVFAIGGIMAFQSGRNMRNEMLRLALLSDLSPELASLFSDRTIPDLPVAIDFDRYLAMETALSPDQPYFQPPLLGSNGWVVAPGRSASGRALFAFDSHDGWGMPSLFYEVHLFFTGDADEESVRGFSVPGLPGVINGFNEFMAWGFTNIGDSQDLYLETRSEQDPLRFKGRSGWYQAARETVRIPVSGQAAHELEIIRTENGPLVQTDPPLSLRWSALEIGDDYGLDGLFLLNRATSFEAFMAAIDLFPAPSANVTYADTEGNIAFRTLGLLPRRGQGDGLLPLAADDPDSAWLELMPLALTEGRVNLPRSVNPESGYLIKANARVAEPPLISADNAPGYRQARLEELLGTGQPISFDDMARWQGDWHNKQAEWLLPALLKLVDPAEGAKLHALLDAWSTEPVNEPDLLTPLLFNEWYLAIAEAVFEPALGADRYQSLLANSYVLNHALDRLILDDGQSPWWRGEKQTIVAGAFAAIAEKLAAGDLAENWGSAHGLLFKHEMSGAVPGLSTLIDRGPYAWGGGNPTVGRARFRYDRPYTATGGATVRLVVEMSEPMRIGAVMPGGQSGHPASPHYDDQLDAWMARTLDPIAASAEAVGAVATTLVPSETSN